MDGFSSADIKKSAVSFMHSYLCMHTHIESLRNRAIDGKMQ